MDVRIAITWIPLSMPCIAVNIFIITIKPWLFMSSSKRNNWSLILDLKSVRSSIGEIQIRIETNEENKRIFNKKKLIFMSFLISDARIHRWQPGTSSFVEKSSHTLLSFTFQRVSDYKTFLIHKLHLAAFSLSLSFLTCGFHEKPNLWSKIEKFL